MEERRLSVLRALLRTHCLLQVLQDRNIIKIFCSNFKIFKESKKSESKHVCM